MNRTSENPLHNQVRMLLTRGVDEILPKIQPAEKADLVAAMQTIVLGGGQRNDVSLKPMQAALDKHLSRIALTDETQISEIMNKLVALYRKGMTLYYSAMEIFIPGFVDKQVKDGAERVDIIDAQIGEGGIEEGVVVTTIHAPKKL